MADIEMVIKIPEEMYKNIQSENFWLDSGLTLSNAYDFIKNGIPIPKGHGRLIDVDKLTKCVIDQVTMPYVPINKIQNAPTIIEADTESAVQE